MASQDRRTNMIHSSINAPMKKGGAGGGFTWGSPKNDGNNPEALEFVPVGLPAQTTGVVTQTIQAAPVQAAPSPTFQYQQASFPSLGGNVVQQVASNWGPPAAVVPPVLQETALRAGAQEVVGQQHPRNMFAKKANTAQRQQAVAVVNNAQEGMIDWNAAGIPPAVIQTIVTSNAAAAHLGPYAQKPVPIAMDQLQARNAATVQQYKTLAPSVAKPVTQNVRKVAGGIHQPR